MRKLARMVAEVYYKGATIIKFIDFRSGLSYVLPLMASFSEPSKGGYFHFVDTLHFPYIVAKESDFDVTFGKVIEYLEEPNIASGRIVFESLLFPDPLFLKNARDDVKKESFETWMDDIKYFLNVMTDYRIIPGVDTLTELPIDRKEELRTLFELEIPTPRAVAIDIEVITPGEFAEPSEAKYPIATIGIFDGEKKLVLVNDEVVEKEKIDDFTLMREGVEYMVFPDESNLLEKFKEIVLSYQVVLGWNSDAFDLLYIMNRVKKLKKEHLNVYYIFEKKENESPSITFLYNFPEAEGKLSLNPYAKGVIAPVHIDLMRFFGHPAIKNYAFAGLYNGVSLEEVSEALLGEQKLFKSEKMVWEMSPTELILYNAKDAELTWKLFAFDDFLPWKLMVLFSRTSKLGIERLIRHGISYWIEAMMLYEAKREGVVLPKSESMGRDLIHKPVKKASGEWSYEGAIVIEPERGIYEDVTVYDFASLYPTLMIEKNLSFETVSNTNRALLEGVEFEIPEIKTHVIKEKGFVTKILSLLRDLRVKEYKKKAKDASLPEEKRKFYDAVQMTLKVFINASYGVFGSKTTRLYAVPTAESVTASGRLALRSVIEWVEKNGGKVIYGDTDSVFIIGLDEDKLSELERLVKGVLGLEIERDKVFKWVAIRSKKNYIGKTTDGKLVIKGLTIKKSNVPEISQRLFSEFEDMLKNAESREDVVKAFKEMEKGLEKIVEKLKKYDFDPMEVAIKKKLGQKVHEYKPFSDIVKAILYEMLVRKGYRPTERLAKEVFNQMKTGKKKTTLATLLGGEDIPIITWDEIKKTLGIHVGAEIPIVKVKGQKMFRMAKYAKPEEVDIIWAFEKAFTPFAQLIEAVGEDAEKIKERMIKKLKT